MSLKTLKKRINWKNNKFFVKKNLIFLLIAAFCVIIFILVQFSPKKRLARFGLAFTGDNFIKCINFYATDEINLFLQAGMNPNLKDKYRTPAIVLAVRLVNKETVRSLLKYGANTNITDQDGKTALMEAASKGSLEMVKMLIENGADLQITDEWGWTALFRVEAPQLEKKFAFLFEHGANFSHRDSEGNTVLLNSIKRNISQAAILIKNYCKVNVQDQDGDTPLILAVKYRSFELVKLLVENEAKIDIQNEAGENALSLALDPMPFPRILPGYASEEIALYLLENGANPNICDTSGKTILMKSAEERLPRLMKALIAKGVDVNAVDDFGKNALFYATSGWLPINKEIVSILKNVTKKENK
jgi:ankyrin repeat protein